MKFKNIRTVIIKPDGSAVFQPYPSWFNGVGTIYRLGVGETEENSKAIVRLLEIGENNTVRIPAEVMKEIPSYMKVLRPDGRYAIAIRTKRGGAKHRLAFGGEIVLSDETIPYLEKGENNSFIPESAIGSDTRKRLRVFDYFEGYTIDVPGDE